MQLSYCLLFFFIITNNIKWAALKLSFENYSTNIFVDKLRKMSQPYDSGLKHIYLNLHKVLNIIYCLYIQLFYSLF